MKRIDESASAPHRNLQVPEKRSIRIGLLWHSVRSGNLGVGALTESNLALIRECCANLGLEPSFVVMGGREPGEAYVKGGDVEAHDVDRSFLISPAGYWRTLGGLDCVIDIGGGDSFAEIYDNKRFAFLWLTKYLAVKRGRPLLLSPQTIGPFERQPWRTLAGFIMNRSDVVVARDPVSYDLARRLAPKTNVAMSIDVAFALPYEPRVRHDRDTIEVGVNVSGLLFTTSEVSKGFGLDVDYAELMRALLRDLVARQDVRVKLITHVVSDQLADDDDARIADRLAAEFPEVERVPDFASPSAAKSYISGLDLLIAGRMHACIAAFSSGVPVVPVAYSRKFSGLFEGVLDYSAGVPVKGMSTAQASDYLRSAIDRRHDLRSEVETRLQVVQSRLDAYRDVLTDFLRASASGRAA